MEHQITINQKNLFQIKTVIYISQNFITICGVANTVYLL